MKTKEALGTESRARLETLLGATEDEFQNVYSHLAEYEVLQREARALTTELQTVRDGDSAAAGVQAAVLEAVAVLDVSATRMATVTQELHSAHEAVLASADRLRAAIAAGEDVGPLTELEEAFDALRERTRELDSTRGLLDETRQALDRASEAVAEASDTAA
ncbi:MAG TPA: hypothetical protein VL551_35230 [Actinospica sp.]|jgi:hypothetical protein|nr:hypothetical protein [Actinospica sp.]